MTPPPTSIDGTDITGATIDGQDVGEITVDGQTVFSAGAPSSGLLHNYDFSDPGTTTSTVPDLAGTDDLTGSYSSLNSTINGIQAGEFGSSFEVLDASYTDKSEPYDKYFVGRMSGSQNASNPIVFQGGGQLFLNSVSSFDLFQGSVVSGPGFTTNNVILTARFGSTDIIRLNGSVGGSGDAGSGTLRGLTIGRSDDNGALFDVGQMLVYDPTASGYSVSDIENFLSGKWGITI
jgi:hypothetical protein